MNFTHAPATTATETAVFFTGLATKQLKRCSDRIFREIPHAAGEAEEDFLLSRIYLVLGARQQILSQTEVTR